MSSVSAITAPRIFDGHQWHEDAALLIEDGRVSALVPRGDIPKSADIQSLDAGFLAPGFVDLQVNGGGGALLNNDPTVEGITTICAAHARFGSTAIFPTLITDTPEMRDRTLAAGIAAAEAGVPGFAGLHLEGPHLSVARKGAHDPALIRPMQDEDIAALVAARRDLPALMTTVAPESITPAQVTTLAEAGIAVSIGHSGAGIEDALALVGAGAGMITHLFNAMSQMTGRDPGVVGAALSTATLNVGIIADGHHVHPASIAAAVKAKAGGPGRLFLVSDAMSIVGTDATEIVLNGRKILRRDGKLTLEDGTLAGADLELATAVRVMHQKVGIDLAEALRMASLYPARAAALKSCGELTKGSRADVVWLGDDLQPRATWIGGARLSANAG